MTSEVGVRVLNDTVLQLPVRLVREIADIAVEQPEVRDVTAITDPLLMAAMPWAVAWRPHNGDESGPLQVRGFETKEALSDHVADLFRTGDIVVVLKAGRPVKFDMRVKARIG